MVFDGHYDVIAEEVASAPAAQPQAPSPALRPLDRLVALQRADGSWELDDRLAGVLGEKLGELEKQLAGPAGDPAMARRVLATKLALAFLEEKCESERDEWTLLAAKSRSWLAAQGGEAAG